MRRVELVVNWTFANVNFFFGHILKKTLESFQEIKSQPSQLNDIQVEVIHEDHSKKKIRSESVLA